MSDFINRQIINALNQKFGDIGQVDDLSFSRDSVSVTLSLAGEPSPVTLEAAGLAWNVSDGKMNLYFSELRCPEKRWVQEIFKVVAEKTGRVVSFPDSLKLMPLKMLLQKKRD
ncbi:MAG: hypothetical protein ACI4P3_04000 [Candidatus Spyradosoma sp.]